jgi:hypothetical protein
MSDQETIPQEVIPTQMHTSSGMSKKDYIQLLRIKRMGYLERAACIEELIQDLEGGQQQRDGQQFEDDNRSQEDNNTDGRGRVTSEDDKRLKGNETEALRSARHMEHGDDGRGEVKDEDRDRRLKGNRRETSKA